MTITYVLNDIIGFSRQYFHLENPELIVDAIEFIDHGLDEDEFLFRISDTEEASDWGVTDIKENLANDIFIGKILVVEIQMGYSRISSLSGNEVTAHTDMPCGCKPYGSPFTKFLG